MASEAEIRAAAAKIKHNPGSATALDYQIVERMAKEMGELARYCREALAGH